MTPKPQKENKKNEYIQSLWMLDEYFQGPPVWQLVGNDRQTITRLHNETEKSGVKDSEWNSVTAFQCSRGFAWELLLNHFFLLLNTGYSGINTAHVMVSVNTLQYNHKGHDKVSAFIRTYLQFIFMAWRVKVVWKQTLKHCGGAGEKQTKTKKKKWFQQYKPTCK